MEDTFGTIAGFLMWAYGIVSQIMALVFFIQYCKTDPLLEIILIDGWLAEIKGILPDDDFRHVRRKKKSTSLHNKGIRVTRKQGFNWGFFKKVTNNLAFLLTKRQILSLQLDSNIFNL